jgi:hypothetical protein
MGASPGCCATPSDSWLRVWRAPTGAAYGTAENFVWPPVVSRCWHDTNGREIPQREWRPAPTASTARGFVTVRWVERTDYRTVLRRIKTKHHRLSMTHSVLLAQQ